MAVTISGVASVTVGHPGFFSWWPCCSIKLTLVTPGAPLGKPAEPPWFRTNIMPPDLSWLHHLRSSGEMLPCLLIQAVVLEGILGGETIIAALWWAWGRGGAGGWCRKLTRASTP